MAVNLDNLSPKELQAVIAEANAKMKNAHSNLVAMVKTKIENLLASNSLTLAEVYPTRGGFKAAGRNTRVKAAVVPKYRDPADPSVTWTGRGRQPLWFVKAIKKRGVTAESLLIDGSTKKVPAKAAKKATKKAVKKVSVKKAAKA